MLVLVCCSVAAQGPKDATTPEWQKAAGGHAEFEVASVRLDKGDFKTPSFALSADDWFADPHGRFHADFPVIVYIDFAYKLWPTGEEQHAMLANLPSWVKDVRYDVEATAPEHATKDQYRLMMQSLLAQRFGMKLHIENKEMPVLLMTLEKPGKTGPKLIPHDQGPPCDKAANTVASCYGFMANRPKDGLVTFGSRGAPMDLIGKFLGNTGGMTGEISRPVVDRTGLTGLWDFSLQVASPFEKRPEGDANPGPTIMEGMREQLGLRLKPEKAVIPVIVIDHIDSPSEN
jgi:uncharacterized protein (TIGR03435 family)